VTPKPYPHAVQKAARRGVLSASGAKRVEVVLDAKDLENLAAFQVFTGASQGETIRIALAVASGEVQFLSQSQEGKHP
jgi:hypothetical protein